MTEDTRSALRALVLVGGDPAGDGPARWEPSTDYDRIMNEPDDRLIFLPDNYKFFKCPGFFDKEGFDLKLIREPLEERYPSVHEALTRVQIHTEATVRYVSEKHGLALSNNEINKLPEDPAKHFQYRYSVNVISSVDVVAKQTPETAIYRGTDPDVAAELCKFFGGRLRVAVSADRRRAYNYYGYSRVPVFHRRSADNGNHADTLNEHGCLCTYDPDDGEYFIVHDPKKVSAAVKTRQTRENRKRKKGYNYTRVITIYDFNVVVKSLLRTVSSQIPDSRPPNLYRNLCRASVIQHFINAVEAFNTVFGKNAHRRIPEFQSFKTLWKEMAARSKNSWISTSSGGSAYQVQVEKVWAFMDREAQLRKPRDMSLGRHLDKIAERTEGLWEID